jgi:16S rRNA processing protein RimM
MASLNNPVLMATIGAAHGIKGEVRIKTFTGDPLALAGYGPLFAGDGRAFEILAIRPQGTVAVAELFIERATLPGELDEEEFYHADLVGMDVLDERGERIGKVSAVQNFGAGDILEIKGPGLNGELVPFTKAAVPVVDVAMRTIRIDTVAAGLAPDEFGDGTADRPSAPGAFDPKRRARGPREAGGNR